MIRINLLGEKEDRTAIYVLQLASCGLVLALAAGACLYFHMGQAAEMDKLTKRKAALDIRVQDLREQTKAVDLLEKNKTLLSEKLVTIAKLKAKKQGPVRVLDELTRSVPERAWLTAVNQKGEEIGFKGIALDNQTVAQFMEKLKESKYFHNEDLRVSKQYVKDRVKLQQFDVMAKLTSMLLLEADAAKNAEKEREKVSGEGPK
ncbi:MAG TPA: PilN domain-containing protein [Oligoflexia bacterium]|nr:PilN domain-containing protein [Oligoflexia bacterium]